MCDYRFRFFLAFMDACYLTRIAKWNACANCGRGLGTWTTCVHLISLFVEYCGRIHHTLCNNPFSYFSPHPKKWLPDFIDNVLSEQKEKEKRKRNTPIILYFSRSSVPHLACSFVLFLPLYIIPRFHSLIYFSHSFDWTFSRHPFREGILYDYSEHASHNYRTTVGC